MDSTLVIKAKYGDTMRRFNAPINENGQLDLDMSGLRAKIFGLFNFPPDADVILTYVDEDGDVVTLVDDDDLVDVMKQSLKFLRIDVQLRTDKVSKSSASNSKSSTSSTPLRSPRVHTPLHDIHAGVADVLKSAGVADVLKSTVVADLLKAVPEHLVEALSKLSLDLASKAPCSNSAVTELKSFLHSVQQSPDGANSSTNAGNIENPMTSGGSSVPNAATTDHKTALDLKVENVTRGVGVSIKPASAPVDLNLNPPCDSNPSGCATYFEQTVNCDDRKEKKKQNVGRSSISIHFGSPAGASDSARPFGECPFSGMPAANDSSAPPFILPRIAPFKRSSGRNDALGGIFHRGVQCDGCGVHPITGPRFKSKVREDYDLCSICFSDMGNEADYIKIDRPVPNRHPRPFKGLHDPVYWVGSTPTHAMRHCGLKPARSKLDSRFISDVNVLDGTMMAPSTPFTKIWRLRNSGSVAWPQGSRLVWIGGDKFGHADSTELEIPESGVPVDGEIDVAVDFTSPKLTGRYLSYWRMASPSGTKFGQRVWVLIHVVASTNEAFSDGVQVLNLNFPPDFSGSKYPEVIDVNVQPVMDSGIVESSAPTPTTSTSVSVPVTVKPTVAVEPPKKDQEIIFSMSDPILVGNGVSTFASPRASPSVSYPIIDLSEAGPIVAVPAVDVLKSSEETDAKDDVEKSLLKELEEMGFKQVDLNKEILRMHEYDLEQAVDDLCGVSEWDPILDELQEMGFRDEEMNRKLLKKNNGSIKGVVMDLLTGEKA